MADALAELLVEAREAAGLSQAALARAIGVSRITIHEAELGRDPRGSTLARYRSALPGLMPADLLGGGRDRVPPSLAAAWLKQREIFGAVAARLERRVRVAADGAVERSLTTTGLRGLRGKLRDPAVRTDVVRMALRGSSASLPARFVAAPSDLEGKPVVIDDGSFVHEVKFARSLERTGIAYARAEASGRVPIEHIAAPVADAVACLALGSCVAVEHPVVELHLALELPAELLEGREPVLLAWAGPFVPEGGARDLADRLYPGGRGTVLRRSARGMAAIVRRPLVGICHALGWRARSSRRPARSAAGEAPSPFRIAREHAGLSVRELAARMEVSPTTVSQVERGRDVRRSTLQGFLRALPDLSPWDLLRGDDDLPLRSLEAWMFMRDLFGCEVEEAVKTVRLSASGDVTMEIRTSRLVRRRDAPGDFHLRLGYSPTVMRNPKARLRSVRASLAAAKSSIRIAPIAGVDGERLHQLIVPPALARAGVTFTRTFVHPGGFALTAARARERTLEAGPFHEGASFAATLPTRRLRLSVRFPPGCWPADARVHAWPLTQVPDPQAPDLAAQLHPDGLRVEAHRARRTIAVAVERPLMHVKYALSWELR